MATRRSARGAAGQTPQSSTPLESLTIYLEGKFDAFGETKASLEKIVTSKGGKVSRSTTKSTTHVVCSEDAYVAQGKNLKAAADASLPIVSPQWIIDINSQDKTLDHDVYLWSNLVAINGATTNGATTNGAKATKKRVAQNKVDEEHDQKKSKAAGADETKNGSETAGNGKKVAEGQFATSDKVVVELDPECPMRNWVVHVEPSTGLIWDASLNQSNSGKNANKFYKIQIVQDGSGDQFRTWTRWGRVGETGQSALLGDGTEADAVKNFNKKFKDKSGLAWDNRGADPKPGKYAFVERSYNPDSEDEADDVKPANDVKMEDAEEDQPMPECTLEKPVQELMEFIFNQKFFDANMSALNYDANKMPLGKLSKATITRGFQQLKNLAALLDDPSLATSEWNMSFAAAKEHLSNTYYSVIPHAFGRNRPPVISENNLLKKEVELLESLSDMKDAAEIMKIDRKTQHTTHPLDRQFQGLGMEEMTPLDQNGDEFKVLSRYLNDSRGSTHNVNYAVQQIFRIERQGETARFDESPYSKIKSDRRLLWHGSRATNFGGILSQGLRIAPPEAPVSGYMFGKGIYLADMSSKSANYCCSYITGGEALLLLCEAELGDPMQKLICASYQAGETAKAGGMYSTWGMGNTGPSDWVDASIAHSSLKGIKIPDLEKTPGPTNVKGAGLYYNEFIVYDVAQVKLRYLFRVKM